VMVILLFPSRCLLQEQEQEQEQVRTSASTSLGSILVEEQTFPGTLAVLVDQQ